MLNYMSIKHSELNKIKWATIPPEIRSKMMKEKAEKRWANTSVTQKSKNAKMLNDFRWSKDKIA